VAGPSLGGALTYAWTVSYNSTSYILPPGTVTTASAFTFTPSQAGTYTVALHVSDSHGHTALANVAITVATEAPLVTIRNAPAFGSAGTPISLDSSVVTPTGAVAAAYAWSVTRDGQPFSLPGGTLTSASSFTFTPTGEGLFGITLTVTDSVGGTGKSSAFISVSGALSASILGAPRSSLAGKPITLTDGAPPRSLAGPLTYAWSVTVNGAAYALPQGTVVDASTFTFTPAGPGNYAVTLLVNDSLGHSASANAVIPVTTGMPTLAIAGTPTQSTPAGASITLTGSASIPGTADAFALSWSVFSSGAGKVTATGTGPAFSYRPSAPGVDVVTLTANDSNQSGVSGSTSVVVPISSASSATLILTAPVTPLQPWMANQVLATVSPPASGVTYTFAWTVVGEGRAFAAHGAGATTAAQSLFQFTPLASGFVPGKRDGHRQRRQRCLRQPALPDRACRPADGGHRRPECRAGFDGTSGHSRRPGRRRRVEHWRSSVSVECYRAGRIPLRRNRPEPQLQSAGAGRLLGHLAVADAAGDTATAARSFTVQPVIQNAQPPSFSGSSFTVFLSTGLPTSGSTECLPTTGLSSRTGRNTRTCWATVRTSPSRQCSAPAIP